MYNNREVETGLHKNVICFFDQQAKKTPEAVALIFERQTLSYKKLSERSNQLARYLKEQGVSAEMLVPICVERGLEMVIGILGILKAGGAYVPIDPSYPQDRINYMLNDTAATLIVSNSLNRNKLDNTTATIIEIDRDWPLIINQPTTDLDEEIAPDQLAYVIYTSGSTGKPKGVMIEHGNAASFINWCCQEFSSSSFKTVYAATSMCFDLSVFELFFTLSTGKSIRILQNGLEIGRYLHVDREVMINTVPGIVENLLKEGIDLSNVTAINMAGEPVPAHIVESLDTEKVEVRNLYGPTEDTTYSTTYRLKKGASVLIGKPITGTQAYILTPDNELCAAGMEGEICLAGSGLARGYLNQPELTAEKFISKSFEWGFGPRLYKTGDLGQMLPDGNITYLGRIDDQIKISGHRIEPGEIEYCLMQSGLINQAVVLAKNDAEGTKRLVSYVVPKGYFDKTNVQLFLKDKLPGHLVPSVWVQLNRLPVTLNGKVDKKALPEPDWNFITRETYTAPQNKVEQKLTDIWQELLQMPKIGIYDDFFDLGGYSLLAVRLISIIEKNFKMWLTPRDILECTTIAGLAKRISEQGNPLHAANQLKSLIKMKEGSKTPLYVVCGSGGTVFAFRDFVNMLDTDQPVYGLQQPISIKELENFPNTIEGVATKYIDEILKQNPDGPYAISGHCMGGTIAYEMARQLKLLGKEVALLALFETDVNKKGNLAAPGTNTLQQYPAKVKKTLAEALLKIDFEAFLLLNHTKQAINYKLNKFKAKAEQTELYAFNYITKAFEVAGSNYSLLPYDGDVLVFYAKERYYFVDKVNNIHYKKLSYDAIKNDWNNYAKSVKFYEIDGEHSSIFERSNATKFASILQNHLNTLAHGT